MNERTLPQAKLRQTKVTIMKTNYATLILTLLVVALATQSNFQESEVGKTASSQPSARKGFTISGFQPGIRAEQVLQRFPERFSRRDSVLSSADVQLVLDDEDYVVGVVGTQGSIAEKDGVALFSFSAGYNQAKALVETIPEVRVTNTSFMKTEFVYGNQLLRLEHFAQMGPDGNKGLLASVVLTDVKQRRSQ